LNGQDRPVGAAETSDLIERYQHNYKLEERVGEEQIWQHLELERALTRDLLQSTPESRRATFVEAYSRLYRELPWLNVVDDERMLPDPGDWQRLIGPAPATVYEVGSGSGALARALAARGYTVEATEITVERKTDDSLTWSETDGVHLADYATAAPYDAVVSNQVVEHLHPDDIREHFRGAHAIVRPGGRYVLETPLWYEGPADLSRVFGYDEAVGMHLHEYTHRELIAEALAAGFNRILVPVSVPQGLRRRFGVPLHASGAYARYVQAVEALLDALPRGGRKRAARLLKVPLFTRTLRLVAVR
jgi:2-polyprenyl-3-methyl-5-hydroxy-6-metoxy-1,4-benzoquinol methylase